jgi:hypothetical protein
LAFPRQSPELVTDREYYLPTLFPSIPAKNFPSLSNLNYWNARIGTSMQGPPERVPMKEESEHLHACLEHARAFGFSVPPDSYALIVSGHCMSAASICEGDVVFMQERPAKHGDAVDAYLEEKGRTLKRYHVENGQGVLRADSPGYPEYPVTTGVTVCGVMVGLLRGAFAPKESR